MQANKIIKVKKHTRYKKTGTIDKQKIYDTFQAYATTGKYSVTEATRLTSKICDVSIRSVAYARAYFDKGKDKLDSLEIKHNELRKEFDEFKIKVSKQLNK